MEYSLVFWGVLIFCLICLIQLFFLLLLRWRNSIGQTSDTGALRPVSVIICARNEVSNLQQFLPLVLNQDYPPDLFEVLLVDDQSTDGTAALLSQLQYQYPQLKVLHIDPNIQKDLPGKKYALREGIAAAKFDRLLLTDADCYPASVLWLQIMANQPAEIVLGYGAYQKQSSLLNQFIRWETIHTAIQYFSYAFVGRPYMGVGRNLCYDQSVLQNLEKAESFQEVYRQTPSGDDDLLISQMARAANTGICLLADTHTVSLAQSDWSSWWRQKTRHSSTGKYYPSNIKRYLGAYSLSHCLYWFMAILLFVYLGVHIGEPHAISLLGIVALFFFLRLSLYWWNTALWYRALAEKNIFWFYPIGDLGWAIYNVLLSPYIFFKNRQQWK